jgi:DNA sulfur modification protein DndD
MIPAFKEIGDGTTALAHLDEVEAVVRPQALALLTEMDDLNLHYSTLERVVQRADSAAAGLLLDELRLADQRVGSTETTLKSRQDELKVLRGQLVTLERERRRILEDQAAATLDADRSALAARTAQALADYEQRLLEHKLVQLRAEFVGRFNRLARKTDLIADVRIDPETFAATLVDRSGHEVPKANLSAGEKQIYAIAMLWALARTSGRPLPMIIDTPLARLDSEHRANLVNRYFPAASHQVVLLSTDTELDEALVKELGKSVSHAYRLDYEGTQNRTVVSRGYFGNEGPWEHRRALQQA